MWRSQPTLSAAKRGQALAGTFLVNTALILLICALITPETPDPPRTLKLQTVFWAPSHALQEEQIPVADAPDRADEALAAAALPEAPAIDFSVLDDVPTSVPLPEYRMGPMTTDLAMQAPTYVFQEAANAPAAPAINVSSTIQTAKPTLRVPPQYPMKAKQMGIEGFVVMDLQIGPDGRVEKVRIVEQSPQGVFERSAVRAVHRWRFEVPEPGVWQRLRIRYELEK